MRINVPVGIALPSYCQAKGGVILSRIAVWLAVTLLTAGVVGGVMFSRLGSEDTPERDSPIENEANNNLMQLNEGRPLSAQLLESTDQESKEDPILVDLDVDHIERGDQRLLVGNFDGARREYVKATNDFLADLPADLLLRLAITAEQMGDTKKSEVLYKEAIRSATDGSMIRILALAGLARTWQSTGQLAQAHELLSELFLRYSSKEELKDEVKFQIAYQLGSVTQLRYFASRQQPESTMDSLEYHWIGPSIDAMIEILQQHGDPKLSSAPANATVAQFDLLQRPSADVNLIAVDSTASLMPIEDILNRYSSQAMISFEPSRLAAQIIEGRMSRLSVSGLPLALVLDHLLSPLGLVWIQDGDTVNIYQEAEASADKVSYLAQVADRVLRNIELSLPRDARRDSSLLHRGNLSLQNDDIETATVRYSELEKLFPNGELAAKLSFNTALVDVGNENPASAIKRLFFTVDQSLNQSLQAKSYGWIGRLELRHGRSDRAIYALSRGLSLARDPQVRQDITMNLAKAYLLESDPFSSNRVLFNNVDAVIDPSERKKAAVFAAYARFLGMVPGEGLRNEGERMVIALAAIAPSDAEEFTDRLIIGRAFFEVGFGSRSTEFLQLALESAPHLHWRRRVAFELATNQYRSGELADAAKNYETLLDGEPDATSILAQIKLAEIALSQKQLERCLAYCQQIWQQNITEEQKANTLSIMGRAYQRLGRHEIAAVCFSGILPQEADFESKENASPASLQTTVN